MFSRRRSTQEPSRTGLFRRRDTEPAVPAPAAPASAPAASSAPADAAATLPSPPQSPPVQPTAPYAWPAASQGPSHWPQPPSQPTPPPPPHHPPPQLHSPPQSPPLAPRDYARPPPPPPRNWQPPHMTQPAQSPPQPQPQPPAYRPPHIANLTALEGGRAQPNPLLPPGPNGTVFGLTPDQLGARIAALEASPIVRLGAFFDRFDPPPRAPPPPPRDAALEERMGNLFIARGADPAQVTPHMPELAAVMAQNAALSNQLAHERAYKAHREAWHAANPRRGVFGTRPATPPLPPLPEEALTDPQGLLEHMVHGAGLLQAPVPGCKYCVPVAQMREGMARQYEDHQAGLRRRREERWRQRVGEWRARYGREYDHARAAGVQDRFGEGWEYLEGGAAWDALQAEEERRAPRYSSD